MTEAIRTQLSKIFSDHASTMYAEQERREFRDREERRLEDDFLFDFDVFCRDTVVPLFEDVSQEVREAGHSCTVTSTTHGKFFTGSSEAPGVVFMFYPGADAQEGYVLKPYSTHVAVFANTAKLLVQIHSMAVLPGGFAPAKAPEALPLAELTSDRLGGVCIEVIRETLRRMESGNSCAVPAS